MRPTLPWWLQTYEAWATVTGAASVDERWTYRDAAQDERNRQRRQRQTIIVDARRPQTSSSSSRNR